MESCVSYREILRSNIGEKALDTESDGELCVIQRDSAVKYWREGTRHRG